MSDIEHDTWREVDLDCCGGIGDHRSGCLTTKVARLTQQRNALLKAAKELVELAYEYNSVRGQLVTDTPEDEKFTKTIWAIEAAITAVEKGDE